VIAFARRYLAAALAVLIVVTLYLLSLEPTATASVRESLAKRFHFVSSVLPEATATVIHDTRAVAPSLRQIQGWISTVGAGVALSDIDGDGLPNDACYVDTVANRVLVAPVPGSGQRYEAFTLDFSGFRFDGTMAPMGCLPGDFQESGHTDLVVYFWGRTPVAFLHKDGPAAQPLSAASFVPRELLPGNERWFTNAATSADLDGDGHVDLVFGNYFEDNARILDPNTEAGQNMQHSMSAALNGAGVKLLLWSGAFQGADPQVSFRDVSDAVPVGARGGWTLAVGAADLTGNQLPELYLANDFGPDRLLLNESAPGAARFALVIGKRRFTTPKSKTLGRDSYKGMGVDFGDLSRHGMFDIVVSNITEPYALEESNFAFRNTGHAQDFAQGYAPFTDESEALGLSRAGWGWDVKFGDFDNSGALSIVEATGFLRGTVNRWPELQELAMANDQLLHIPSAWPRFRAGDDLSGHDQDAFFVLSDSGRYVNIGQEVGIAAANAVNPSRGIAVADCFGDGRLDLAIANQWGRTLFFRNLSPTRNRFLGLHLRIPLTPLPGSKIFDGHPNAAPPSRPAIGATALLEFPDGSRRIAQVDGGNGHAGRRSPDIHFGLGAIPDSTELSVLIRWRDAAGRPHEHALTLSPGWHTVLLGTQG